MNIKLINDSYEDFYYSTVQHVALKMLTNEQDYQSWINSKVY